jgi:predicted porin
MRQVRRLSGLAAGIALSAASAHAQSSVQMYGVIDAYAGKKQLASATGAKTISVDSGGMTTSQWGFRGTEDLGGGLAATFDISGFLRADTGETGRFTGDAFFSRTAFVGLHGSWGTVRLGRISTPNFISSIRLNPFGDSTTFAPVLLHTYVGGQPLEAAINSGGPAGISDSAHNNAIAYTSPNLGGFVGAVSYSFGEVAGDSGANKRVGYSLTYGSGPFLVAFSGEQVDRPTIPAPPVVAAANQKQGQDTQQLGASYDFGVVKLFGQWSRTDVELPAGAERDFRTAQLGTSVPMGAGKVLLSIASTRKTETAVPDVRRKTWTLGYDHDLSRRTDVYAMVMRDAVTRLRSGTTVAVGVRHRF